VSADPGTGPAPAGVQARSILAQYLRPSVFPATVDALVDAAESEHAPDSAIELLRGLPPATYHTTNEVWLALGGTAETRPLAPEEPPVAPEAPPAAAAPQEPPSAPTPPPAAVPPAAAALAERVVGTAGAVVTCAVRLVLSVPNEVGSRFARLVRRR